MSTYSFSYLKPQKVAYLKRRPWWAFWRNDAIEFREEMVYTVINDIPENEGEWLVGVLNFELFNAGRSMLRRIFGHDACNFQMVHCQSENRYISNTVFSDHVVDVAYTNLLHNSDRLG